MDIVRESSYQTPLSNSTLLPLMLLSLASQKHTPSQTQTVSSILSEYDFIIVGAGSAGATVAGRLSEMPCVNVLLLEAGGAPPLLNDIPVYGRNFWFTDLDWAYKTVPQKHTAKLLKERKVIWPSGKGLGGSSLLNGMLYVRGNKRNYDDWEAQGAKGWSYSDVFTYFLKSEDNKNVEYLLNGYHNIGGPLTVEKPEYHPEFKEKIFEAAEDFGYEILDSNAARQTGFTDFQATTRRHQRCSTAKAYLVPAEHRQNLHILPNAFVKKVLIENNRAVGVSFEVNNISYEIKARKEVIMSAGTVNTAQLLMLSGVGPKEELKKHGIRVLADLPVGKNFHDHCAAVLNYELDSSIPPALVKVSDRNNILDYLHRRQGPLTSTELLSVIAFLNSKSARLRKDDPNFQLYFIELPSELPKLQFGLEEFAYKQIYGPYENKPIYACASSLLQPKSRGSVKLQSSNPHDPPLIDPNYFAHPQDLEDVVQGMKVCQRIANSRAMQDVGSKPFNTSYPGCEQFFHSQNEDDYFRCVAQALVITLSHQVGTTKMGDPYDPTTVVDPELRVKGIKGLRVVDASIMPIVPSGNTNIPTIMVAEKASDIIKDSIYCEGYE